MPFSCLLLSWISFALDECVLYKGQHWCNDACLWMITAILCVPNAWRRTRRTANGGTRHAPFALNRSSGSLCIFPMTAVSCSNVLSSNMRCIGSATVWCPRSSITLARFLIIRARVTTCRWYTMLHCPMSYSSCAAIECSDYWCHQNDIPVLSCLCDGTDVQVGEVLERLVGFCGQSVKPYAAHERQNPAGSSCRCPLLMELMNQTCWQLNGGLASNWDASSYLATNFCCRRARAEMSSAW